MPVVVRDDALEPSLVVRDLQQVQVQRLQRDEAIHRHVSLLPQPVRAVHRLDVLLRVLRLTRRPRAYPVRVVQHHRVRGAQVDAQSAGARGEEEERDRGVAVEALDGFVALLLRRGAVDGAARPLPERAVVLQQVERLRLNRLVGTHLHELNEHEDAVLGGNQHAQHGI